MSEELAREDEEDEEAGRQRMREGKDERIEVSLDLIPFQFHQLVSPRLSSIFGSLLHSSIFLWLVALHLLTPFSKSLSPAGNPLFCFRIRSFSIHSHMFLGLFNAECTNFFCNESFFNDKQSYHFFIFFFLIGRKFIIFSF